MRTQWTTKGNWNAGSWSCDRGLHWYLRNFGGVWTPQPPPSVRHWNWLTLSRVRVSVASCSSTFTTMLGQSNVKNSAYFYDVSFRNIRTIQRSNLIKYLSCQPNSKYTPCRLCATCLTPDHPNCVRRRVQLIQGVFFSCFTDKPRPKV